MRAFALLVALVVFWSGFLTRGPVTAGAMTIAAQAEAWSPTGGTLDASGGAVDEPLVDDRHAPGQAESLADVQWLLMDGAEAPAPGTVMARPRAYAARTRLDPFLDGPQRPPCATVRVA